MEEKRGNLKVQGRKVKVSTIQKSFVERVSPQKNLQMFGFDGFIIST